PARARKSAEAHKSAKKPRKSSIFECKNSIRVKLSPLSAEKAFVCLPRRQTDRDDRASRRPRSSRNRPGPSRSRPRRGSNGGPRRAHPCGTSASTARVHPRRFALEGDWNGLVSNRAGERGLERLARGCG